MIPWTFHSPQPVRSSSCPAILWNHTLRWARVEQGKNVERGWWGSGNWICVYLQRICAVAGKWTYNLTCLTNAFKRFSSYFPQHRDQSCCLFSLLSPSLLLFPSIYSHSSPCWHSYSYSVSVGFAFPFCVSLCKSLNSVFWFNLQFDCNRYPSAGAKRFYQWVSERERWDSWRYSTQREQLSTGDWQRLTGIRHARPSVVLVVWPMTIGNAIVN